MNTPRTPPPATRAPSDSDRYDWVAVQAAFVERFGAAEVVYHLYVTLWMASTRDRKHAGPLLILSRRLQQAWVEYMQATDNAAPKAEGPLPADHLAALLSTLGRIRWLETLPEGEDPVACGTAFIESRRLLARLLAEQGR